MGRIEGSTGHGATGDRGVEVTCDLGHVQRVYLRGMTQAMAAGCAAMLDGTSDLYVSKPRDNPIAGSTLARCEIDGSWITAKPFGYEDEQ